MGNVSNAHQSDDYFIRLKREIVPRSDLNFWQGLFLNTSPKSEFSGLSQVLSSQKGNIKYICELCIEYIESVWLGLSDLTPELSLIAENSLNFLTFVIPLTIEQNLYDFFWDSKMLGYRAIKSICGLYFTPGFTVADLAQVNYNSSNFLEHLDYSLETLNRKILVLKLLASCMPDKNYSWKMLLTKGIVPNQQFLYGLLNTFACKPKGDSIVLIKVAVKVLEVLMKTSNSENYFEEDMNFIKNMIFQKKISSLNTIKDFFQSFSDESMNKVLTAIELASTSLENSAEIMSIINLLSSLFECSPNYCKYTAISTHFSIISTILSSRKVLNYKITGVALAKVFYSLSCHREFSVSLSVQESNSLLQLISEIILYPDYEFQDYFSLLTGILCNISAYLIEIDSVSSISLVKVYEYITNKDWLLQKEKNHYNVFYLVQAFNNILQYQWEGAGYLVYWMVKKRESFYKIIRMQINVPDEACLDDLATEGELENSEIEDSIEENSENLQGEEEEEKHVALESENKLSEEDNAMRLENLSQGLILGLGAEGPDEVVQRTSYLNTHVSTFSDENDRRNTIQYVEIIKEEDWKPTPEWILMWKTKLPLKALFITIKEMFSSVIEMQENNKTLEEIVKFIQDSTLVGLLPRPHPIYLLIN
jgi:High-temperature-induced dauer-formation protein